MTERTDYDAVIVGASLAGCTSALMLGRAGLNVALVERSPDPAAFKRICGHFIQSSAVPTLERLGLLTPIEAAGGLRSRVRMWTRWGVIEPSPPDVLPASVNLRRERLDPLLRRVAMEQDGVETLLGHAVTGLLRGGEAVTGVEATSKSGRTLRLSAPLVVAADGRDSTVAKLAGVKAKVTRHGRFSYAAYFEGPPPAGAPDGTLWFLDPQWAAAFPTDGGLTMYACMPTKDRLPEFRRDLAAALRTFVADIPEAPPVLESRQIGPVLGKIEMPNVHRAVVAPGLALIGDAALATDPLFGIGCGWAFESGEWLADGVTPALQGAEPLSAGLGRYRRRHRRKLNGHAFLIHDYATGRRLSGAERVLFSAAAYDARVATLFNRFGTRTAGPELLMPTFGRALAVHARRQLRGRPTRTSGQLSVPEALA